MDNLNELIKDILGSANTLAIQVQILCSEELIEPDTAKIMVVEIEDIKDAAVEIEANLDGAIIAAAQDDEGPEPHDDEWD